MGAIRAICGSCRAAFNVNADSAGRLVACPKCQQPITLSNARESQNAVAGPTLVQRTAPRNDNRTTSDDSNVQANGTEALLVLTKLRYYGTAKLLRRLAENLIGWRLGAVFMYIAFIAIFVLGCEIVLGYGWVFFAFGIPAAFMLIALHYVPGDGHVSAGYLQAAEQTQHQAVKAGRRVLINRLGWGVVVVVASAALSLILGYGISTLTTKARAVARESEVERQRQKTEALNRLKEAAKLFEQDQKKQQEQRKQEALHDRIEAQIAAPIIARQERLEDFKRKWWEAVKRAVLAQFKTPGTVVFSPNATVFFVKGEDYGTNVIVNDGSFYAHGQVDVEDESGNARGYFFSAEARVDYDGLRFEITQPLKLVER